MKLNIVFKISKMAKLISSLQLHVARVWVQTGCATHLAPVYTTVTHDVCKLCTHAGWFGVLYRRGPAGFVLRASRVASLYPSVTQAHPGVGHVLRARFTVKASHVVPVRHVTHPVRANPCVHI